MFCKHPTPEPIMIMTSAVLCALAFSVPQFSLLMWVALIPLITALRARIAQQTYRARDGFLFGIIYYSLLLSWIWVMYPLDWLGLGLSTAQSALLMTLMWLTLATLCALGPTLICWLWAKSPRHDWGQILTLACWWVIIEFVQGQSQCGFTWGRLGVSQYPTPLLIQTASLWGSLGITFSIIIINGGLSLLIDRQLSPSKRQQTALILLLFFSTNLSVNLLLYHNQPQPQSTATVAVVQGNISAYDKWSEDQLETILHTYLTLSHKALTQQPDLLFWPETAVPVDLEESPDIALAYQDLARQGQLHFLFGTFSHDQEARYNSIMLLDPQGQFFAEAYHKQHLVPFGEYLPLRALITTLAPQLLALNRFGEDMTAGDRAHILTTDQGCIGSLICFDTIFPELARQAVQEGAEALFIATNDSWYQASPAITQHLGQAIFRAVENHRTIIRAANTGISAIIAPDGQITAMLPENAADVIVQSIPLHRKQTLYARTGDIIVPLALIYLLANHVLKRRK